MQSKGVRAHDLHLAETQTQAGVGKIYSGEGQAPVLRAQSEPTFAHPCISVGLFKPSLPPAICKPGAGSPMFWLQSSGFCYIIKAKLTSFGLKETFQD